jgi:LacI family repressor for deo operon, udp, cdd, tsx, nupC, and nupG
MICGPRGNVLTSTRSQGAAGELVAAILHLIPCMCSTATFPLRPALKRLPAWLDLPDRPSAMFCQSDQMAFGFISELARHGISTPEDVSVVGFDDIDIARRFIPALTTVRQPRTALGLPPPKFSSATSGHLTTSSKPTILDVELIARDSTRGLQVENDVIRSFI